MSDTPPPSARQDPLDTGHDYDGIREHDNRLPNWWLATLFLAIIFGFGYYAYYHVLKAGPSSMQAYEAEVAAAADQAAEQARAKGALTDDILLGLTHDPAEVARGEARFKQTCAACHGPLGQGLIGPNLTDDYWLHGSRPTEILHTVTYGVADKGMPTWGPVLGPDEVEAAVVYVLTLKGKHVPGKAPQGVLVAANSVPSGAAPTTNPAPAGAALTRSPSPSGATPAVTAPPPGSAPAAGKPAR